MSKLLLGGVDAGEEAAKGVSFDGVSDYLNGQSFSGTNLEFDVYYVSGTMPFGVPQTAKYTWVHVSVSGSYTVENIGLNFKGRLSNIKLDSVVDMPMDNADTAHINLGTGGDFVPNGVLDTAQRGANQYNCVASEFDGVNDSLVKSSLAGLVDSKELTVSLSLKANESSPLMLQMASGGSTKVAVIASSSSATFTIYAFNSASSFVFRAVLDGYVLNKNYHISLSVDTSVLNKLVAVINGDIVSPSITDFIVDGLMDLTAVTETRLSYNGSLYYEESLGELYFDTSYIDLTTDNPFWDSTTNKPKPVRQVLEETGNTPLIAMPISADNPTLNLGTGGNFTLNGGGLVGARGASEYIARSCGITAEGLLPANAGYMDLPLSNEILDDFSVVLFVRTNDVSLTYTTNFFEITSTVNSNYSVRIQANSSENLDVKVGLNNASATDAFLVQDWYPVFISKIGTSVKVHLNGTTYSHTFDNTGNNTYSSVNLFWAVGATYVSPVNLTTVYVAKEGVDFSQEENRNLFVDQLGYPKDLQRQIDSGLIPTPLIYMPFDDPDYLGKNLGTGGEFTVNGTVTQGADFSI